MDDAPALSKPMPATLAVVAALAGVSEITVSRVVRNKGAISEATRAKVMRAIETTGYMPNRVAGALASGGSPFVGVIVPSLANIVFPQVLRGIQTAVAASGRQPLVGVSDYDEHVEERLIVSLLAWRPAALLIVGLDHTETSRRLLMQSHIRVAELMDIDREPIDAAIGLSHRQAGYATGRHLIERGYRRIGYAGHDWDADRRAHLRYQGLRDALAEASLGLHSEWRHPGPSSTLAGRDALGAILAQAPDTDVVVFSNDDMAVGGVFHLVGAGIPVRERVGVFGFNGLDIGQALPWRLSTIHSNRFEIGRVATELVFRSAERPANREIIDTGFEIIPGETA